jgi:hypothetical protein
MDPNHIAIVATEVDENLRAGRPLILVSGSGRAADALVSMLRHSRKTEDDTAGLRIKAEALNLLRQPDLFHEFDVARGPEEFARAAILPFRLTSSRRLHCRSSQAASCTNA